MISITRIILELGVFLKVFVRAILEHFRGGLPVATAK